MPVKRAIKKTPKTVVPVVDANKKHQVGDIIAVVRYAKVVNVYDTEMLVKDIDYESEFRILGRQMLDQLRSAALYDSVETVTGTRAAEVVSTSFNTPMTVCFIKKNGDTRVMVCRLKDTEPLMGRSYVDDLEETEGDKMAQVDHRTIQWAIVNKVKYVVKGR